MMTFAATYRRKGRNGEPDERREVPFWVLILIAAFLTGGGGVSTGAIFAAIIKGTLGVDVQQASEARESVHRDRQATESAAESVAGNVDKLSKAFENLSTAVERIEARGERLEATVATLGSDLRGMKGQIAKLEAAKKEPKIQ